MDSENHEACARPDSNREPQPQGCKATSFPLGYNTLGKELQIFQNLYFNNHKHKFLFVY